MNIFTYKLNVDTLWLYAHKRIDTTNAGEADTEIAQILEECEKSGSPKASDLIVYLDAEDLEYLSSAGLRVILKLKKQCPSLEIINASDLIYQTLEMTGFTEMMPVSKCYRKLSIDGCEIIGRGAKATIYRYDAETVVKVYNDPAALPAITKERTLARTAFVLGIPTAISYDVIKVGDRFASMFELLNAKAYSALIRENASRIPELVTTYADILKQIHETDIKQKDFENVPDVKLLINKWLEKDKPFLEEADFKKLCEMVKAVPDTTNLLHCDYHLNNLMMQGDETLLIDMDTVSKGHPIFELANVFFNYGDYSKLDVKGFEDFQGFSVKYADEIWDVFINEYLGESGKDKLNAVTDRVRLLSYLRVLHHMAKRDAESEEAKVTIEKVVNTIHELTQKIDNLTF